MDGLKKTATGKYKKKSVIENSQSALVDHAEVYIPQPAVTVGRAYREGFETSHVTRYEASRHVSLSSQAPENPRCGPTVSSGLPRVYFTEPGFVLLAVESECAVGMGEKSMGDVATVNHANTIFSV